MTKRARRNVYENGILVGCYAQSHDFDGYPCRVFIPRREEDIESDRFDRVLAAHEKEARRHKALITNLGWATSPDGICSKTSRGLLDSKLENGKVKHTWPRR